MKASQTQTKANNEETVTSEPIIDPKIDNEVNAQKITLDMVKPQDRDQGYDTRTPMWMRKLLEFSPGVFTWLLILSPVVVSLMGVPDILVYYVAFLVVYWTYRGIKFMIGLILGFQRYKRDMTTDWVSKLQTEKPEAYAKLKIFYLFAVYREALDVLEPTIASFANSDIDTKKISIVFAMEDKFKDQCIENFEYLKKKYGHKFGEMLYFIHPPDIEGEIVGVKGGNINWAARQFVKTVEERNEDVHDYFMFVCDSDLRVDPKLLSAMTYKYLTCEKPDRKFFASALHTFNNNIWSVPPLVRIFSTTLTLVILHNWVVSKKSAETFSAYGVNLQTARDAEYWCPDIPNDDTAFYWNALIRFHGDFAGEEVYVPTYNDAVENKTFVQTHISLYKQQHRWGWGIVIFPTTLANMFLNKQIPFKKKIPIILTLIDNRLFYLTVVYLITFGLPILNIVSPQYVYSSASHNLPTLISTLLTALLIINVPVIVFRRKFTATPQSWKWWRHVLDFLETFIIAFNMLSFAFIPYVQAQTELMFGKGKKIRKFYITDKVKIATPQK